MTTWIDISDVEVDPGKPAFTSVSKRQRDNLKAFAEGDPSVPAANKLVAAAFKQPTATSQTQVLAHQGQQAQSLPADGVTYTFFTGVAVVAGTYTFAGTRTDHTNNQTKVYVNGIEVYSPTTATFTSTSLTVGAGERIEVTVRNIGFSSQTLTEYRLLSEFIVPMAQASFMRLS